MKFNSNTSRYFYQSHSKEISKYISSSTSYLNLVNESSNIPDNLFLNLLKVDPEIDILETLNQNAEKNSLDVLILTDIFELSDDIYSTLKYIKEYLKEDGILILSSINPLWNLIVKILEKLRYKKPTVVKSYIKPNKIENVLSALSYTKIKNYNRIYFPYNLFGIGKALNFVFYIFLPFLNLGIRNYLVYSNLNGSRKTMSKSILIPAKNEEGNLHELISRIPDFDSKFETIIICGPSKDNTLEKALQLKNLFLQKNIKVLEQSQNGKANAIWEGMENCNNDLIAILDSDLSVDPETLPFFFEIIENGYADFVNGTRLIYKMEKGAMRSLNKFGNRIFQFLISKLISVKLTDSLCGTKVFKKSNIDFIKKWQNNMIFKDPFCDFDLIFSAAYSSKKIVEFPVHYRTRTYGTTNISRFRDGWKLLFYFFNSYFLFRTDFIRNYERKK